MKTFTKLALATAVAAVASSSYALESMTDADMSQATGQDGIDIVISPAAGGVTIDQLFIHDNDGLASGDAGAIVLDDGTGAGGLSITGGDITIALDADGNAGSPYLNAAISFADPVSINIGGVYVGDSGDNAGPYTGANTRGATNQAKVLGALGLTMNNTVINAQLGNDAVQGAMVNVTATMTGGLSIDTLELVDATGNAGGSATQGGLFIDNITVTDTGSADMTVDTNIDIDATDGIVIADNKAPGSSYYVYMSDLGISDGNGTLQNTIGDVEIVGMSMGQSTIRISGH